MIRKSIYEPADRPDDQVCKGRSSSEQFGLGYVVPQTGGYLNMIVGSTNDRLTKDRITSHQKHPTNLRTYGDIQ